MLDQICIVFEWVEYQLHLNLHLFTMQELLGIMKSRWKIIPYKRAQARRLDEVPQRAVPCKWWSALDCRPGSMP